MSESARILNFVRSTRASGRDFIAGFSEYANQHTQWRIHWEPQGLSGLKQPWESYRFDAVISRDHSELAPLIEAGLPAVLLRHQLEETPSAIQITTDDQAVAASIARLFDFKGFRHFAFLGYRDRIWSQRREKYFNDAAAEFGHSPFRLKLVGELVNGDDDCNREILHNWFSDLPEKTAIMAANDDLGSAVIRSSRELGHRIPDDRIVVGVGNDQPICEMTSPALSSVPLHFHRAGTESARNLNAILNHEGDAAANILCAAGSIAERQSSDKTAINDPALARAIAYLSENSHRQIAINEAVAVSGISRRVLEKRFRETLSTTIASYHRELRANWISDLLERSDLTLERIAEAADLPSGSELSRFFKAVRGESPSAYRSRISGP